MSDSSGWIAERVPISVDAIATMSNEPVPYHLKRWWFALGGSAYNDRTLSRFFILHGAVLPVTVILLLVMHIGMVRLHGVTELRFEAEEQGPVRHFKFFPEHFYTELMIGITLMILLTALATLLPVEMGPRANPLITPEIIKPEWFFYVAFRWLKLFSGVTAVLTQGLIVFVMFCWPFIDDWLVRKFKYPEISIWVGVVGVFTIIGMTVWEGLVAH